MIRPTYLMLRCLHPGNLTDTKNAGPWKIHLLGTMASFWGIYVEFGGRYAFQYVSMKTYKLLDVFGDCLLSTMVMVQYHLGNMCKRYLLFYPPITKSGIVPYIIDNVFYIAPRNARGIKLPDVARCCERLSNWFIAPPLE